MELSPIEQELYDFIKKNDGVTILQVQKELTPKHVGAIGKLKKIEKVKKEKRREGDSTYGLNKMITYYVIVKEEENNGVC